MAFRELKARDIVLIVLTLCSIIITFFLPRTGQDPSYHSFADQREIFGIPNFYNVITNLPFVIIGVMGILSSSQEANNKHSIAYLILFVGIAGIGFGSAWYHYHPANASLVWDRIPMTITFMSYFSIIVSRYVDRKLGSMILIPLLIAGVLSIYYWFATEQHGSGDLRPYAWVQFYPMLSIPLILFLYPASRSIKLKIVSIILVYAVAKIAEHADQAIFGFHEIISGHSLKHLFASVSVLLIMLTLKGKPKAMQTNEAVLN
jgi:hypothetical protein